MTNRKHHCRYCGQIFVADVCKKTTRIPSAGFIEPVRVCDICYDQLERGDPVCISKQVAAMPGRTQPPPRCKVQRRSADGRRWITQIAVRGIVSAFDQLRVPETLCELLERGTPSVREAASRLLGALPKLRRVSRHPPARPRAANHPPPHRPLAQVPRAARPRRVHVAARGGAACGRQHDTKTNAATTLASLTSTEAGRARSCARRAASAP